MTVPKEADMIAEPGPPAGTTIPYPTCPTCCTHDHTKEVVTMPQERHRYLNPLPQHPMSPYQYEGDDPDSAELLVTAVDEDRDQRVLDELDRAKPGDMFAYPQSSGEQVILVIARFEPTGIAGTTGVTG